MLLSPIDCDSDTQSRLYALINIIDIIPYFHINGGRISKLLDKGRVVMARVVALVLFLNVFVSANAYARFDSTLIKTLQQTPLMQKAKAIKNQVTRKLVISGMSFLIACTGIVSCDTPHDTVAVQEKGAAIADHSHVGSSFYVVVDTADSPKTVSDYAEFIYGEVYEVYDDNLNYHFEYRVNYTHELDYDGSVVTRLKPADSWFWAVKALGDYRETALEPYDDTVIYEEDLTAVLIPPQADEYLEVYLFSDYEKRFNWEDRLYLHGMVVDTYPDDGYALVNISSTLDDHSNSTALAKPYLLLTRWPTTFESGLTYPEGDHHVWIRLNGKILYGERPIEDSAPVVDIWVDKVTKWDVD